MTTPADSVEALRARLNRFGDDEVRRLVFNANDGILAGAGIIEGLEVAGASEHWIVLAVISGLVSGSIGVGSTAYLEESTEVEAIKARRAERARQEALTHAEAVEELALQDEQRGVSPELAAQVAEQVLQAGTHVGDDADEAPLVHPVAAAVRSGFAFALGAFLPALVVVLTPDEYNQVATIATVLIALTVTSIIAAFSSKVSAARTVLRTVTIGTAAMLATTGVGLLLG